MNCLCWPCDLKNIEEIIEVSLQLKDGTILQKTEMSAEEAEQFLFQWITE